MVKEKKERDFGSEFPKKDDWNSWSLYIIKTIDSLQDRADDLEDMVNSLNLEIHTELTKLKVYSKIASVISSVITAILVSVISGIIVYNLTQKAEREYISKELPNIEQQYQRK